MSMSNTKMDYTITAPSSETYLNRIPTPEPIRTDVTRFNNPLASTPVRQYEDWVHIPQVTTTSDSTVRKAATQIQNPNYGGKIDQPPSSRAG